MQAHLHTITTAKFVVLLVRSGFGGLVVSMLASGTRVRGFKPDFFGRKIPQHAFLREGSKAVGPASQICGTLKNPYDYMEVASKAKLVGYVSPELSSFANRGLRARAARGSIEGSTLVHHGRPWSYRRKLKGAVHRGPV
jgi:hypothetical protein